MAKKYYVVWQGTTPGIYTTWEECRAQVHGVAGAAYKSFPTEAEAQAAFAAPPPRAVAKKASNGENSADKVSTDHSSITPAKKPTARRSANLPPNPPSDRHDTVLPLPPEVTANAIAVDAACSGNPGPMEYRGVDLATGATIFHFGPVHGTNNIGEFLAIVHALALLKQQGISKTVYSDSRNALLWVRARKCKTTLQRNARTERLFQLIERAENWLATHSWSDIPLLKWQTSRWGEVPADFGRK